jgi:hypothetical protein
MTEFMLSKEDLSFIEEEIFKRGFTPHSMGFYKSNFGIKEFEPQKVYKRSSDLNKFLEKNSTKNTKKSSKNFRVSPKTLKSQNEEMANLQGLESGVINPSGSPIVGLDPTLGNSVSEECLTEKDSSSDFSSLPTLQAIRSGKESLCIGFDTEYFGDPRYILSYQFAVVWEGELLEYIFLNHQDELLDLKDALSVVLTDLNYKSFDGRKYMKFKACVGFDDSGKPSYEVFESKPHLIASANRIHPLFKDEESGKYEPMSWTIAQGHAMGKINQYAKAAEREWIWSRPHYTFPESYDVTLISHFGRVDLSALKENFFRYASEVQDGILTLDFPIKLNCKSREKGLCANYYCYPLRLHFRDTMSQAPAGSKSLDSLGEVVGIPKLKDDSIDKSRMDKLLKEGPALFFDYASRDSVVTLLYASRLYGFNCEMAPTLTSAAATAFRSLMSEYLDCSGTEDFDKVYRGLEKVGRGKVKNENGPGYLDVSSKEPLSSDANLVQLFASEAFHGGFNGSFRIGWIDKQTWDYDLQSAYPTAMTLIPDINWNDPIKHEIKNQDLDLSFWISESGNVNPMMPFFGYVDFEFPEDCVFPSIPVNDNGRLVYPRSSEGLAGVYACGPEVYLALKLGAKIHCKRGFFLKPLLREDLTVSKSLAYAVRQSVQDRSLAKELFGKKSLEEQLIKTMANSFYGKVAQSVVKKSTWSAYSQQMEDLGCSSVTNPVSASLITAFVRAELIAVLNEIEEIGYKSYSVTTDGFISDVPENVLKDLDMKGFKTLSEKARLFLTDGEDASVWEAKHEQDSFLNLTTRGNVGLDQGSVCAHNSLKSPHTSKSYEDRLWMIDQCLTREGPVVYSQKTFVGFKELALGAPFRVFDSKRRVHQDFDFKRKPVKESFKTIKPTVEGKTYEVENFDTMPFKTIAEFRLYKEKSELCPALRTADHWLKFWLKVEHPTKKLSSDKDLAWAKLLSCVMGHRKGLWTIPALDDPELAVADKCEWLNSQGLAEKKFKESDWKNARRPERTAGMLGKEEIMDFLEILGARDFEI